MFVLRYNDSNGYSPRGMAETDDEIRRDTAIGESHPKAGERGKVVDPVPLRIPLWDALFADGAEIVEFGLGDIVEKDSRGQTLSAWIVGIVIPAQRQTSRSVLPLKSNVEVIEPGRRQSRRRERDEIEAV